MKHTAIVRPMGDAGQKGAALVTVIMISALLLTASVAMLTAVGANSKDTSDVLSGTKAYYAAETGIQSTINVLRNAKKSDGTSVDYNDAVGDPDLSTWVGTNPVAVGTEASYSLNVTDPDGSSNPIRYSTTAYFQQADGSYATTPRTYTSGADTLTISYNNTTSGGPVNQPMAISPFGSFQIVRSQLGGSAAITSTLNFRIDFAMIAPRAGVRSLRGTISTSGGVAFLTGFVLEGSALSLCPNATSCPSGALSFNLPAATTTPQTSAVYGKLAQLEPYRLKVVSTGFGPNGSRKQLEAILEKNFFDDVASPNAITMIGPGSCMVFDPGSSNQVNIDGGSGPAIGVSDSTGLDKINTVIAGMGKKGNISPSPQIFSGEMPSWQSSPAALDDLIKQLRQTAVNSGRDFTTSNPPSDFGSFSTGKGITFCEGDCNMGGSTQGGGILVVTGTLTTSGNPKFNGLILAVGSGGVVRSGGGNEVFTGNLVIAPYNPNNLAAGWGCPTYKVNGGPGDTINSTVAVDQAFDGTPAISDFVLGVAEK